MLNGSIMEGKERNSTFFSNFVIELFNKDITVDELYRELQLKKIRDQNSVELHLAVNKTGTSKGVAFVQIPKSEGQFLTDQDERLIQGKQIKIRKEDGNSRFLKHKKWVIQRGEEVVVTHCKRKLPIPNMTRDWTCIELKTDQPETDTQPFCFDAGGNMMHRKFKNDLDSVMAECFRHGIRKINVPGRCLKQCKDTAAKVEFLNTGKSFRLYFSAGISPHQACEWNGLETIKEFETLYKMADYSSVGLIGLNYSEACEKQSSRSQQKIAFEAQIKMACVHQKPILLVENSAHEDFVDILKLYHKSLPPCAIYCYVGPKEHIQTYISMGFYIAITGHVTKLRYQLAGPIQQALGEGIIPKSRILLASDAPNSESVTLGDGNENRLIALDSSLEKLPPISSQSRNTPRSLFVLKDMIAIGLGENKESVEFARLLCDNYNKFFILDHKSNSSEQSVARSMATDTVKASGRYNVLPVFNMFEGMRGSSFLAHILLAISAILLYVLSQFYY